MVGRTNVSGASADYAVTIKNCGANALVTAKSGLKSYVAVADEDGTAVFDKLAKGVWIFTSSVFASKTIVEIVGKTTTTLLPSLYRQAKYIESSAAQYITTDFVPDDTSGVYLEAATLTPATDGVFCGLQNTSGGNNRWYIGHNDKGAYMGFNTIETEGRQVLGTTKQTYELNWLNDRTRKVNGEETQAITVTLATIAQRAMLFAANVAGSPSLYSSAKIYACRFSKGEETVRDFIPCFRASDDVAGMYDIINGTFYENQGTGSFTAGKYADDDEDNPKYDISPNGLINYYTGIGSTVTASKDGIDIPGTTTIFDGREIHSFVIRPNYFGDIEIVCDDKEAETITVDGNYTVEGSDRVNLYDHGDLCGYDWQICRHNNGYATPEGDEMYYSSSSSGARVANGFFVNEKIDLTNFSELSAEILEVVPTSDAWIFITDSAQTSNQMYYYLANNVSKIISKQQINDVGICTLNVADLDGEFYINIGCRALAANAKATLRVNQVWLE